MKSKYEKTHVITGATGFVGSCIVLELLQTTDAKIVCVVRATSEQSPTARLHNVLSGLIADYKLPKKLYIDIDERVTAVPGDLEIERCGVQSIESLCGAEFWHSAASLQYQDRHKDMIERTNIGGTENALALANAINCSVFNSISTAYVAGRQRGLMKAVTPNPVYVNNHYERSKIAAEALVISSGLAYRIMRPGVVVGHSKTYSTTSTDGIYGLIRNLAKYRGTLERTQSGLANRRPVTMVAESTGSIDLVPVDHVARDAVGLSVADAPQDLYHLTNPKAPRLYDVLAECCYCVGLITPVFVDDDSKLDPLDRKLHRRLEFYNSYLINPKSFDRTSVVNVLGNSASQGFSLDTDRLRSIYDSYLNRYEQSRTSLPVAR